MAILAPPGTYTVQLSVGGQQLSQTLEVRKDPHSAGTEADIQAQMTMLFDLRRDLNAGADIVNQIELVRRQIANLIQVVEDEAITEAGDELEEKLMAVESILIELRLTGPDGQRWAAKLLTKMIYLADRGWRAPIFHRPISSSKCSNCWKNSCRRLSLSSTALLDRDLAAFNELLRTRNVSNIIARVP